ncbi:MAG: hypothetical protein ACJ71J_10655, partial [Nitrososphaeraceae archaeon]
MMYSLQPIVSFTSLSIAYSSEPGVYFVMIAQISCDKLTLQNRLSLNIYIFVRDELIDNKCK